MWNLKYVTNEPMYIQKKQIHRHGEQTCSKGEVGRERDRLGIWGW